MRQEKPIIVEHIRNILDESGNFLLVSYMGIPVKKQEELKNLLSEKSALFQVHKNTLIKKAAENKNYSGLADIELVGGTAIVYGEGEPSEWAKVVKTFAKDNKEVEFKAAFFEGQLLDKSKAGQVAEMPSKDEARAMVLSLLMSGPQKLAGVLRQTYGGFATVVKNYTDKKES